MKIVTEHVNPPIPVRFWDWQAHLEGHEEDRERYGWGHSREAAVTDLVNILLDKCESKAEIEEVSQAHVEYWRNHGN